MAPYYRIVTSASALSPDQPLLESMEKANKEELDKLDERLAEAEKTEGESEISDALKARANYLTRIGDKVCGSDSCHNRTILMRTVMIGSFGRSTKTCAGENTRPRVSDRHSPYSRTDWVFLW